MCLRISRGDISDPELTGELLPVVVFDEEQWEYACSISPLLLLGNSLWRLYVSNRLIWMLGRPEARNSSIGVWEYSLLRTNVQQLEWVKNRQHAEPAKLLHTFVIKIPWKIVSKQLNKSSLDFLVTTAFKSRNS